MGGHREDTTGQLPDDDVIAILRAQHARIRELLAGVEAGRGERRRHAFDELRALLAVHETAEEMVLRPVTRRTAGPAVVDLRNREEAAATKALADLERLDVDSAAFDEKFETLAQAVSAHAELEEREEFPSVLSECSARARRRLGRAVRAAERIAPTHAHPNVAGSAAAQYATGPFASLLDRTRDAIGRITGH